jgi:hypothetical protein
MCLSAAGAFDADMTMVFDCIRKGAFHDLLQQHGHPNAAYIHGKRPTHKRKMPAGPNPKDKKHRKVSMGVQQLQACSGSVAAVLGG